MGLNITRTVGQSFWINYEIKVTLTQIKGKWARVRVDCNEKYDISRTERLKTRLGLLGCAHDKTMCTKCMHEIIDEIQADDQRVQRLREDFVDEGEDQVQEPVELTKIQSKNQETSG